MPTEYRPSGPDLMRNNVTVTPLAAVHICDTCGFEGAPFGHIRGGEMRSACGWQNGEPACIGKGNLQSMAHL